MAHALTFNKSVRPRRQSPVFHPPVERAVVRRVFEKLSAKSLPPSEGPFRDKDAKLARLLEELGPLFGKSMNDALAGAVFFLTPQNMELPFPKPEPVIERGVPDIVYNVEHIHATDQPLSAGELVAHSNIESRNELAVARGEELYVLIAALLQGIGLRANIALLRESSGEMSSALCIADPETFSLVSFALPVHPSFRQIILYSDVEVLGLIQALKAFNHVKKIREVGRTGAYRSLPREAVLAEFD